jgi:hypothetical protein
MKEVEMKKYKARRNGTTVEFDEQILLWRQRNKKAGRHHMDKRTAKKLSVKEAIELSPLSLNLFYSGDK